MEAASLLIFHMHKLSSFSLAIQEHLKMGYSALFRMMVLLYVSNCNYLFFRCFLLLFLTFLALSLLPTFLLVVQYLTTICQACDQWCETVCFWLVSLCEQRRTYHSATVWGKLFFFFRRFLWTKCTYYSATMWGKPFLFSKFFVNVTPGFYGNRSPW